MTADHTYGIPLLNHLSDALSEYSFFILTRNPYWLNKSLVPIRITKAFYLQLNTVARLGKVQHGSTNN
jgi:hypothetical protein